MIQVNLLPEVKNEFIKSQRSKRLVLVSSLAVSGTALGIVIILGSIVYGAQNLQLKSLESSIKENTEKIKKVEGLSKILTVQNQLNSLTNLHNQKPITSRLFTYLPQVTPTDVKYANLKIDLVENTLTVDGTAPSLESVNKFIDTLKFTDYTTDQNTDKKRAFSSVVMSAFTPSTTDPATYSVMAKFDPAIFSTDFETVTLVVPNITTTRSQLESPNALFKEQVKTEGEAR